MPFTPPPPHLTPAQHNALQAAQLRGAAQRPGASPAPAHSAIHIHFHPDWLRDGGPVIAQLARLGRYQSQFESGSSNGSYSPEPGGARWQWEHRHFAGAYDHAAAGERPVYGAVDLTPLGHHAACGHGAAPRFGSAWLQLHPQTSTRSSFCDPDSYWQPEHAGLWPHMDWQQLQCLALPDPLDHYVEAQVHGGLVLARDVAAIVLDPCFADSAVAEAAQRCGPPVHWHPGYRLLPCTLDDAARYRGPAVAALLQALFAQYGKSAALTPRHLGQAQASGRYDSQLLKKAWHCMARFGAHGR